MKTFPLSDTEIQNLRFLFEQVRMSEEDVKAPARAIGRIVERLEAMQVCLFLLREFEGKINDEDRCKERKD